MLKGVLFALASGLMWGLIFVGPMIVPDYPASMQSTGRYVAFGAIALVVAWIKRDALRDLSRADWIEALKQTVIGNLIYYFFLASAIQRTGSPISTMIIGTLPVVIPIFANLLYSKRDGKLPWRRLAPALVIIAAGLIMVNTAELSGKQADFSWWRYASGILLAFISVACWAWYALRNARWLRENPDKNPMMWATVQGLSTLPFSLIGYVAVCWWMSSSEASFALPFGPRPEVFIPLMLAIAVLCSWLGNLCWNIACQRLPTVIVGPLIVFETLAGLAYTFMIRHSWPPLLTLCGVLSLAIGVVLAVRSKPEKPTVVQVSGV